MLPVKSLPATASSFKDNTPTLELFNWVSLKNARPLNKEESITPPFAKSTGMTLSVFVDISIARGFFTLLSSGKPPPATGTSGLLRNPPLNSTANVPPAAPAPPLVLKLPSTNMPSPALRFIVPPSEAINLETTLVCPPSARASIKSRLVAVPDVSIKELASVTI